MVDEQQGLRAHFGHSATADSSASNQRRKLLTEQIRGGLTSKNHWSTWPPLVNQRWLQCFVTRKPGGTSPGPAAQLNTSSGRDNQCWGHQKNCGKIAGGKMRKLRQNSGKSGKIKSPPAVQMGKPEEHRKEAGFLHEVQERQLAAEAQEPHLVHHLHCTK